MADKPITVVCPLCKNNLVRSKNTLSCSPCKASFTQNEGIISFVPTQDEFYEGKYVETRDFETMMPSVLGPLRHVSYRVFVEINIVTRAERFFRHRLRGKKDLKILDLACGGGWKFLTEYGQVTGVDLSQNSLLNAKKVYRTVHQADALKLPFKDQSFDVVTSIDFFEHIAPSKKPACLVEIYRVLKPGGMVLKYIPMDGCDPLSMFTKRYPKLYKKHWIDRDDHVGLESPYKILERFERAGFIIKSRSHCWANLLIPLTYLKYLDNEYRQKSKFIDLMVRSSKTIVKHNILFGIYAVAMNPLFDLVDYLSPLNHGLGFLICAKKV
jgi:ubiquinone/menaquinone biosynthesis C-methylase UbiE